MRSAHTNTHTPQHPSQEWPGAAGTRAQACTSTTHTRAKSGGVQAEHAHKHAHTPQHRSQEWPGAAETGAQAHPPTPPTPARTGGVQAEHAHKHTHTQTPQPGVAGRSPNPSRGTHTRSARPSREWQGTKPSAHTSAHTPQHPSQQWWGTAETRAEARTATPHIRARSGGVQRERVYKQTHSPTPQPGVAGRSGNPSPSTHTHTAHPDQEWRGTNRGRTQTHTHPNTPARSGGAQLKPEPKRTHPHRKLQPGVSGYRRNTHTNTHTPQYPSQEWPGAAETRAQARTPTVHTPDRSGAVRAERAHKQTHTPTPQPEVAGRTRNLSPSTHPHRTAQLGVAGRKQSPHMNTHTPQHPSQEWWGAAES